MLFRSARYDRISQAKKIMVDDKLLSFMFVINAEKLAIDETKKAIDILEKYNIHVDGVVVNKILPEDLIDEFWINKKQEEKKYLEMIIDTFKGKKIFTLPMMKSDIKADNLELMAEKFDELDAI